jgi:hypothetical protein
MNISSKIFVMVAVYNLIPVTVKPDVDSGLIGGKPSSKQQQITGVA